VVAPSGPVPADLLDRGADLLRSWGLAVDVGERVLARHSDLPYLAGTDLARAAELQEAWCSTAYDAVLCARGGYGTLRMLDLLDWHAMAAAIESCPPKLFVGSSDITTLHEAIGHRLGVATLHGPMVATRMFVDEQAEPGSPDPASEQLRRMLFTPEQVRRLSGPHAETFVPGTARGMLVGGNASVLVSSLGDPDTPLPPPGAVALLEDVTEDPYRLDRILTQLLRAGWFDHVAGIALGSWTQCGDQDEVRAMVTDRLAPLGVPMIWDLGFGHCPRTMTLPLGRTATIDADSREVVLDEPALA
jgi:muramoyltetrapeptide carboxypeptidase